MNARQRYELQSYLYQDQKNGYQPESYSEIGKIWDNWHCMILIEANQAFFDVDHDVMEAEIRNELKRDVTYLNLNTRQSIVLFEEPKGDYRFVANHIYTFLKLRYPTRFHMAVSEIFTGHEKMPETLYELERWLESKFYHIEDHVLYSEEHELAVTVKEVMDSRLVQKITHDVNRKDAETMWKHYGRLEAKYQESSLFSAIYVKFVFASVVEALYQDADFSKGRNLVDEIAEIYCSRNEAEVLKVTQRNVEEYSQYANQVAEENAETIKAVENYIMEHCDEDMDAEILGTKFKILPGYLMFQFRILTGYNLNQYIHKVRMEKAYELLHTGKHSWKQVSCEVGYQSMACFVRMYVQYFGQSPE